VALALTLRASKTDFSLPRPTLQAIRPVTSKARERENGRDVNRKVRRFRTRPQRQGCSARYGVRSPLRARWLAGGSAAPPTPAAKDANTRRLANGRASGQVLRDAHEAMGTVMPRWDSDDARARGGATPPREETRPAGLGIGSLQLDVLLTRRSRSRLASGLGLGPLLGP
jgi:hypothetical protein